MEILIGSLSKVADQFDSHVRKSIPHYEDIQKYISRLSIWFIKKNSTIYDLGVLQELRFNISNIHKKNLKFVCIDQSKKMLNLAKKNKIVNINLYLKI